MNNAANPNRVAGGQRAATRRRTNAGYDVFQVPGGQRVNASGSRSGDT